MSYFIKPETKKTFGTVNNNCVVKTHLPSHMHRDDTKNNKTQITRASTPKTIHLHNASLHKTQLITNPSLDNTYQVPSCISLFTNSLPTESHPTFSRGTETVYATDISVPFSRCVDRCDLGSGGWLNPNGWAPRREY